MGQYSFPPNLISDEQWSEMLALAAPDMISTSGTALRARRRCNFAVWILAVYPKGDDPHRSFEMYAVAGEHFARGVRAVRTFLAMQGEVLNQLGLLDEDRLARITVIPSSTT